MGEQSRKKLMGDTGALHPFLSLFSLRVLYIVVGHFVELQL